VSKDRRCPIWGTHATYEPTAGDYGDFDSWRAGGRFRMAYSAVEIIETWDESRDPERAAISQAILEASINSATLTITSDDLQARSNLTKRRTYEENLNLLLKCIAHNFPTLGEDFLFLGMASEAPLDFMIALGWQGDRADSDFFPYLIKYLDYAERRNLVEKESGSYSLRLEGFEYVNSLGLSSSRDSIFVAMWFGSDRVDQFYKCAVKPAIEEAGYDCVRIDDVHHNDKIDEMILSEIRKSRAVVVDITCGLAKPEEWSKSTTVGAPRGGVYFEAGFAAGLGIPIIWCVDENIAGVENVVHFDVRQYNQVRWKEDHEYNREFLRARIEATLGRGPKR